MRPSSYPQIDAPHAIGANLSGTKHKPKAPTAQDLAISAAQRGDHGWYSRKFLAWRLSNSMDADFCLVALKEALAKYGNPEIFNSDQGSQFTSSTWIDVLVDADIKISMDGKGAWRDNRMIERLWRSSKYECVCLNAFEAGSEMRAGISEWLTYDNSERPHSTHGMLPPNEAYASKTEPMRIAAYMKT